MAFDIKKGQETFGCVSTSIGDLCLFSITWGRQKEFHKELGNPINECSPTDFARKFARYICVPKNSLKEDKYRPNKYLLSDNEILSLTGDDLEAIAKLYIEKNEDLFKKLIFKTKKGDQGQLIHYSRYGEVEYFKNKNETYAQYLLRLSINQQEKFAKEIGKTLTSIMPSIKSFSNALGDSIRNTLSWGNSLRKTMESIRAEHVVSPKPVEHAVSVKAAVEPILPGFDFAEMERQIEENRLKPFKDLADRMDRLIDAFAQTTEFMVEANKIQTGIAEEIKSSSDTTKKFSKKILFSLSLLSY